MQLKRNKGLIMLLVKLKYTSVNCKKQYSICKKYNNCMSNKKLWLKVNLNLLVRYCKYAKYRLVHRLLIT